MPRFALFWPVLLLAACAHHPAPGPISTLSLRTEAPQFARSEPVNRDELTELSAALASGGPIELTVFFADWCGDSIREVPRLLSLLEQLPPGQVTLKLINLDADKQDPAGLANAAKVTRIPTIIAQRNGQELGRITESASVTVGADLVQILKPQS